MNADAFSNWINHPRAQCPAKSLVVVVVRNDECLALEQHAMAAAMWAWIADKAVVDTISSSVDDTISRPSYGTDRTTNETTGYHLINTIFVAEITGNHFRSTD